MGGFCLLVELHREGLFISIHLQIPIYSWQGLKWSKWGTRVCWVKGRGYWKCFPPCCLLANYPPCPPPSPGSRRAHSWAPADRRLAGCATAVLPRAWRVTYMGRFCMTVKWPSPGLLADPGEARGCSTNTSVIHSLISRPGRSQGLHYKHIRN